MVDPNPAASAMDKPSCHFSIAKFEEILASHMMNGRRTTPGDTSSAIIWQACATRRGNRLDIPESNQHFAVPLLLDIRPRVIPRRPVSVAPAIDIRHGNIHFPFCSVLHNKLITKNDFPGKRFLQGKFSTLRALTVKFMKHCRLTLEGGFDARQFSSPFYLQLKIADGVFLHDFFFNKQSFASFLKASHGQFKCHIENETCQLKANQLSTVKAIELNKQNWITPENDNGFSGQPDFDSIFNFDDLVLKRSDQAEFDALKADLSHPTVTSDYAFWERTRERVTTGLLLSKFFSVSKVHYTAYARNLCEAELSRS